MLPSAASGITLTQVGDALNQVELQAGPGDTGVSFILGSGGLPGSRTSHGLTP